MSSPQENEQQNVPVAPTPIVVPPTTPVESSTTPVVPSTPPVVPSTPPSEVSEESEVSDDRTDYHDLCPCEPTRVPVVLELSPVVSIFITKPIISIVNNAAICRPKKYKCKDKY